MYEDCLYSCLTLPAKMTHFVVRLFKKAEIHTKDKLKRYESNRIINISTIKIMSTSCILLDQNVNAHDIDTMVLKTFSYPLPRGHLGG